MQTHPHQILHPNIPDLRQFRKVDGGARKTGTNRWVLKRKQNFSFRGIQLFGQSLAFAAADQDGNAAAKLVAESLGIKGTPALVLPDGRVSTGFRDAREIQKTFLSGTQQQQ